MGLALASLAHPSTEVPGCIVSLRDTPPLDDDPATFGHFAEGREPDAKWQKPLLSAAYRRIALN